MDKTIRQQLPKGLAVYFVRTESNKVYAGWFVNSGHYTDLCQDENARDILRGMLDNSEPGDAGAIRVIGSTLHIDPSEAVAPFTSSGVRVVPPAEVEEGEIFENVLLEEDEYKEAPDREIIIKVKSRNQKAVKALKKLYRGKCQITGGDQTFVKRDGTLYSEAHHLVPLGEGGADNPKNIVVISPLVHRMLHYADVEGLNLENIKESDENGTHLEFRINGDTYMIKWHPKHAELVLKSN